LADCYIILDERRSLLELILLVLACHKKTIGTHYKKDTLLSLSGAEKLKLEDAKMILYLFSQHCSRFAEEVTIDDYLEMTGRTMQNKDPIRRSVKRLSALRIIYLNHNGKRQEQKLFEMCELKRGKITYQINSFFESKLKARGRGHRNIGLYSFIFKDETYRAYSQNAIRLLVMLHLIYSLDDLDMIDERILDQEKKNLKVLLVKYFDNPNPLFSKWIDYSCDVFLNEYNHPSQGRLWL